ncbi:unnamed protein product [Closterium sp. NIES-54]
MVTTTTPGGQRVSICTCTRTGRHLAMFTRRLGSSLYTLATDPPHEAASAQVSTTGQVAPPCSCHLLLHQTLLWHHRLGHPSLPRLRGMHSRLLVSGLPRSLPPLPPSPGPPCFPCVEGRQRATPHSSSFPPTTAPLQTLHMGVKGQIVDVLIPWIRAVRLQLHERFHQDLPVLLLHSDRGGEFSSGLLWDFCHWEGILQSFTLPPSPQQNGIAESRIGLVMEVTRTSMIHVDAPHFLWPFAVRYAAHQLNLSPRVSLLETSPTMRWTGEVGDASVFRFYHPTSHRVFPSLDVTFDESVPFYRLFPYSSAPPLPPPLFLAPGPPPVDPPPPQDPAPSRATRGTASGGAASGGVEPGGAEPGGAEFEDAGSGHAEPGGAEPGGAEPAGVEPGGAEPRGAQSEGADSGGAEPWGTSSSGGSAVELPELEPQETLETLELEVLELLLELVVQEVLRLLVLEVLIPGVLELSGLVVVGALELETLRSLELLGLEALELEALALVALELEELELVELDLEAVVREALELEVLELGTSGLTEHHEPATHPASRVRTGRRVPHPCPPPVPGTHAMALRPSSVPMRVLPPAPLESSLPAVPDPESDRARAASPTVSRLLATIVTDPSVESTAASALVAELVDFDAACCLDYATTLVAEFEYTSPPSVGGECALGTDVHEDKQEDFECLAAAVPRFASMLLAPEGDPDAPDIPTPRSYGEAITGPYSSQWQAAMDAKMASSKSTSTYVDAVPLSRANISATGGDYSHTFSPTPKMTTLRVLLHVAAQRDYGLHSLDFSTAFLQGSLHEEIWLRRPPGFTGSFPAGTRWSLQRPVYDLRQAPREWHDTLRTTLAALGFTPSTADPSLFLRTDTLLPPFYVLMYVDGLVLQRFDFHFSSPQPTPLSTSHSLSAPPLNESVEPSEPFGAVLTMAGPEERGGRGAGGSREAQAQGQPCDSAMAPVQPSLCPPRDEPRVFGLDKFNGDNFAEWSFRMENLFDHYDLLEVMEGTEKRPENDPEKSPWVRKSAQGYLLLGQALGSSQIRHIKPFQREPEKEPKAWAALKGVHAPATAAVAVVLERQMAALRIEEDEAVEEGVQKFFDLLTRFEGADLNYNVKRAILLEDFRRRELASADGAGAASIGRGYGCGRGRGRGKGRFGSNNFNGGRRSGRYSSDNKSYRRGRGRFDGECHYCHKSGHMWRDCFKLPDGWTPAQSQQGRGAGGGRGRGRGGRGRRGGGAANMRNGDNESESMDDRFLCQFFFVSTQAPAAAEKDESFEEPAAVGKVTLYSLDYWVIDNGATYSMTPRADLLTELELSPVKHVTSDLGQQAEVKGMGKAMFKGADGKMVGLKNAGMDTSSKGAKTYTARLGERILWDLHEDRGFYNEMWQILVVPMPKERQVAASISTNGEAVGSGDGANDRAKEIESKKCNLVGTSKLGEHEESGAAAKEQHKGEENPKAAAEEEYGESMWGTIASAAFSNPTSATGECDWLTLHRRMGHVTLPILQQLVKNEMVAGIRVKGEPDEVLGCPTCMQAKLTRYPFSSLEAMAKAPLDEVVMDVVGPLKLGAARADYFLTIVDVYTCMTWVYVLSKKSDVAETVKTDWLPMVERQQDWLVKSIRTDRGGELLNKDFGLWLKKNGIRHSLTMPYSPAMNSITERANCTITETARGLLIEAGLPDYFWPNAVRSACVAKNRALNHVGADKWVPYVEWIGRKPKVDMIWVFGCMCMALVPKHLRHNKLDAKVIWAVQLGMAQNSKGWLLWDPYTKKFLVSRDCKFMENLMYKDWKAENETKIGMRFGEVKSSRLEHVELPLEMSSGSTTTRQSSLMNGRESAKDAEEEQEEVQQPLAGTALIVGEDEESDNEECAFAFFSPVEMPGEPATLKEALESNDAEEWKKAKESELKSIEGNGTWELVELPEGRKAITSKWLFKIKSDADGKIERYKSRLVAKGYQQKEKVNYKELIAPVVKPTTLRTLLAGAAIKG